MARVKRGTIANKKRAKVLKKTKGFGWGRKSKERAAKEALLHAESRMFRGRKEKKRNARTLWNVKVNAGARKDGMSYSVLISGLKKAGVKLDRKVLATLAEKYPKAFAEVTKIASATKPAKVAKAAKSDK
jgi:large subunit ribosomal protein L20